MVSNAYNHLDVKFCYEDKINFNYKWRKEMNLKKIGLVSAFVFGTSMAVIAVAGDTSAEDKDKDTGTVLLDDAISGSHKIDAVCAGVELFHLSGDLKDLYPSPIDYDPALEPTVINDLNQKLGGLVKLCKEKDDSEATAE